MFVYWIERIGSLGCFLWSFLPHSCHFISFHNCQTSWKNCAEMLSLQSYFCPHHFAEIVLAKITNDLTAKWSGLFSVFILLALSGVFGNADLFLNSKIFISSGFYNIVFIWLFPHILDYFSKSLNGPSYSVNALYIHILWVPRILFLPPQRLVCYLCWTSYYYGFRACSSV